MISIFKKVGRRKVFSCKLCFKKMLMALRNGKCQFRYVSYGSIFDIGYVNRFGEKIR